MGVMHVAIAPLNLVCNSHNALGNEINDFADVEDNAKCRRSNHEVGEDLLFGGVANVAVHLVGARRYLALD